MLQFNRQPVKGVEYLRSNKLVENTPHSVAQFLRRTPSLDKVEALFLYKLLFYNDTDILVLL